jgi:hypothetical protein
VAAAVVSLAPDSALLLPTDGQSLDERLSAVVGNVEFRPAHLDYHSHLGADARGDGSVRPHLDR